MAQLVLLTGSRAGMIAPIHVGYYLIGRSPECQIRPKTRSVSRNHCLVHFGRKAPASLSDLRVETPSGGRELEDSPRFHVLDLKSTSGTKIDGQRITSRVWHPVENGAELRCGKIAWQVIVPGLESASMPAASHAKPLSDAAESGRDDNETSNGEIRVNALAESTAEEPASGCPASEEPANPPRRPDVAKADVDANILKGGAWQESDVAAFLAAHDDADRENRYESIRSGVKRADDGETHVFEGEDSFDEDGSFCDDSASGIELGDAPTNGKNPTNVGNSAVRSESKASSGPKLTSQEQRKKDARDKADADRRAKLAKKKKADKKRAARLNSGGSNPVFEKMKMVFAIFLVVGTLGLVIYQVIQFRSGPPPSVVEGID